MIYTDPLVSTVINDFIDTALIVYGAVLFGVAIYLAWMWIDSFNQNE